MSDQPGHTTVVGGLLARLAAGDASANAELIEHSVDRLRLLARQMLRDNQRVRRKNQTDDVLQNALIRLHRSLKAVTPDSPRSFLGLAATQIRRELIDLYHHDRRHKRGGGANVAAGGGKDTNGDPMPFDRTDPKMHPDQKVTLHEAVNSLDDELREVVDLLYFHGMTQDEVADYIGVSTKTVKRRWREARLSLADIYGVDVEPA